MDKIIYILALFLVVASCKKEDDPTTLGPEIEFVSMSTDIVEEFTDSLYITISYKDPNGDLGYANPDEKPLEIKDERYENAQPYPVPQVAPNGAEISVQGTFRIYINTLVRRSERGSEQTFFTLRLRDRAGNWSNSITTPNITITEYKEEE